MKELQQQNIISVIKHFPGHGATNQDSHTILPIINSDINTLQKEDMFPFEQAIHEGADAILIGHLLIKKITGIYPASLSRKFIIKYLKRKYKYKGLIITDDLKMRAIRFIYGSTFAVKKALQAGNDIIVFRFKSSEENAVFKLCLNLIKNGKIKESQINRSVRKIINIKEKYNISDFDIPKGINIDEINNEIENIRSIVNIYEN